MRKLVLASAGRRDSLPGQSCGDSNDRPRGPQHSTTRPMTCVDLNDIVEEHLGNPHKRRHLSKHLRRSRPRQSCQNDHRNDVIAVFGWANAARVSATLWRHADRSGA